MGRPRPALLTAVRLTAAAGLVSVFVLLGVSAAERTFCSSCAITYVLVGAYAGIALFGWSRLGLPRPGAGAAWTAAATAPPISSCSRWVRAPRCGGARGAGAVGARRRRRSRPRPRRLRGLAPSAGAAGAGRFAPPLSRGAGRAAPAAALAPGPGRRAGARHRVDRRPLRPLRGSARVWEAAAAAAPVRELAIESRHFPLDAECNPLMKSAPGSGALPGRARADLPGARPDVLRPPGSLFANQRGLRRRRSSRWPAHSPRARSWRPARRARPPPRGSRRTSPWPRAISPRARRWWWSTGARRVRSRRSCTRSSWREATGPHPAFASLPPPNAEGRTCTEEPRWRSSHEDALSSALWLTLLAVPVHAGEETVTFKSGDETASGFLVTPEGKGPFPAVIVIQEWWGLDDWVKDQARALAKEGYVALAVDLYRGKVTDKQDEAHQLMIGPAARPRHARPEGGLRLPAPRGPT